jgi:hypothetical protein
MLWNEKRRELIYSRQLNINENAICAKALNRTNVTEIKTYEKQVFKITCKWENKLSKTRPILEAVGGTERENNNIYGRKMKDCTARSWLALGLHYWRARINKDSRKLWPTVSWKFFKREHISHYFNFYMYDKIYLLLLIWAHYFKIAQNETL